MPKAFAHDIISTYRYLRSAMVAALLALFISVAFESVVGQGCWLGSLSAYYYTPVRTVFVGSLIAIGLALIAYKGHSPEEEVVLNFSGLMAIVVALVPTVPDDSCPSTGFALSDSEIARAVTNNVVTLVVVTVLSAVVWFVLRRKGGFESVVESVVGRPDSAANDGGAAAKSPAVRPVVIAIVCLLIVVGELVFFLVRPDQFIARSHGIAAVTMSIGLVFVMLFNAWWAKPDGDSPHRPVYRRWYRALAILLGVLVLVTAGFAVVIGTNHLILALELAIFGIFGLYWILQSKELWDLTEQGQDPEGRKAVTIGA